MSKEKIEIPEKFKKIVEQIEQMNILDLSELVKILEEKFNVSAQAAYAPAAGVSSLPAAGVGAEEKTEFTVKLKSSGEQKIQVIKVLKEALGLGLKEAKDLTDAAPVIIKQGMDKKSTDELKKKLEEAGGIVELE